MKEALTTKWGADSKLTCGCMWSRPAPDIDWTLVKVKDSHFCQCEHGGLGENQQAQLLLLFKSFSDRILVMGWVNTTTSPMHHPNLCVSVCVFAALYMIEIDMSAVGITEN